jgi:hypothetical protein
MDFDGLWLQIFDYCNRQNKAPGKVYAGGLSSGLGLGGYCSGWYQ